MSDTTVQDCLNQLPVAVFVCDARGALLFGNRRFLAQDLALESVVDAAGLPADTDVACTVRVRLAGGGSLVLAVMARRTEWQGRPAAFCVASPSEERLRVLTDQALVAITLVDEQGRVSEWNQGAERLTGHPREQVLGRPYWEVMELLAPPEQRTAERRQAHEAAVREALRTGQVSFGGVRKMEVWRAEGNTLWLEQFVFPIRAGTGWCLGGIAHDVTERERAEEERRNSDERTRLIFQYLNDIVTIIDGTGTQVFVGPQVERVLGYQPAELLGTNGFERIHPEDQEAMMTALAEGIQTPGLIRQVEYRYQHKQGHWVTLEAIGCNLLDTPVKGVVLTIRDVTDRKRVELALRASEERYRAAALATGQLVYDWDLPSGKVLWAGAIEAITGCTEAEFAAVDLAGWEKLIHPEDREEVLARLSQSRAERTPLHLEYRLRRKDGSYVHVEENGGWLTDAQGAPYRMLGALKDVAERRRLEGQLQQAMKMEAVGRLAGGVAHDFNNLLTGITGNIELALMDMPPADPMVERLREMEKAARSTAALTRQLLAFSRKQIIEPKVITLNELIRNLQKMLVRILGEDVELKVALAGDLGPTRVDPGQMEQILVNLAVNARDAMPDGGHLSVHTSNVSLDAAWCERHPGGMAPGDYVLLAVSDTGEGMSDEVKAHLFEPFFTTKPKGRGTGLGLATIYGAVQQAGGLIEVYSELGRGTTFKIYLPRVAAKAQPLETGPRTDDMPRGTETVLVVEDESWVRDLAVKVLTLLGYRVLAAANGGEAFLLAEQHPGRIDLLFTDVVMPGINGKQLADRMRALRPEIRVLFTSGYTEDVIVHHGVVEEGLSFLAKPYSPVALARKLREALK